MMRISIIILVFTALSIPVVRDQLQRPVPPFRNAILSTEKRVEDLLNRLSGEEKVSLLIGSSPRVGPNKGKTDPRYF